MSEFKLLLIALLLWGTSTLANLPTAGDNLDQDVNTIHVRVGLLNGLTPGLNLKTRVEPTTLPLAEQTLADLRILFNALRGTEVAPPHSLTTLTCARAVCFAENP